MYCVSGEECVLSRLELHIDLYIRHCQRWRLHIAVVDSALTFLMYRASLITSIIVVPCKFAAIRTRKDVPCCSTMGIYSYSTDLEGS